jgi:hypothetical protein
VIPGSVHKSNITSLVLLDHSNHGNSPPFSPSPTQSHISSSRSLIPRQIPLVSVTHYAPRVLLRPWTEIQRSRLPLAASSSTYLEFPRVSHHHWTPDFVFFVRYRRAAGNYGMLKFTSPPHICVVAPFGLTPSHNN